MSEKCRDCLQKQNKVFKGIDQRLQIMASLIRQIQCEIKKSETQIEQKLYLIDESKVVEYLPF